MQVLSHLDDSAPGGAALLASKLTAPSPRSAVARPHLQQRLCADEHSKLVLISAPAGFGKTTLMTQCAAQLRDLKVKTAWLTLDPADNDLERLLIYLKAAFDQIDGGAVEPSPPAWSSPETAPNLASRVSSCTQPFALFLDEFEEIQSPAVLDYFRKLISYLPPGGRIFLGSRNHPNVGISRLRAQVQLLLIGPVELRFSVAECGELLRARRGLALSEDDVRALHQRTEGWVAAIHLASLALSMRSDATDFIARFSTGVSDVFEYLTQDVLALQPPKILDFMLRTSILRELPPGLCAAVTGCTDSATLLQTMERGGLFLIRTGDQSHAYRYHSLFAEFLRDQLDRHDPGAATRLHIIASDWYREQHRPVPAIEHALSSRDFDRVVNLLRAHVEEIFKVGRWELLQSWFDRIPIEVLRPYADLMFIFALALPRRDQYLSLNQFVSRIEHQAGSAPEWAASNTVRLLTMQDRLKQCLQLAEEDSLHPQSGTEGLRLPALFLANALIAADQFPQALRYLDECKRSFDALNCPPLLALAEKVHGTMELGQGRLRDATRRLRHAYDTLAPGDRGCLECTVGVALAILLYEAGDSDAAQRLLDECFPAALGPGFPDILIAGSVVRARILAANGRQQDALDVLAELQARGHDAQLPRVVASAWLERARIAVLGADYAQAQVCLDKAEAQGDWGALKGFSPYANDVDSLPIGRLRLMLHTGRAAAAIPLVRKQLRDALTRQRNFRALKLRLFLACALRETGDQRGAMRHLRSALQFAASEGFVSAFRSEGLLVTRLLRELHESPAHSAADRVSAEFLRQVEFPTLPTPLQSAVTADRKASTQDRQASLKLGLTFSEARVLKLLSKGLSNRELASQLLVSESTVKTHLARINVKLGARRRAEAIAAARQLQIID